MDHVNVKHQGRELDVYFTEEPVSMTGPKGTPGHAKAMVLDQVTACDTYTGENIEVTKQLREQVVRTLQRDHAVEIAENEDDAKKTGWEPFLPDEILFGKK